MSSRKEKYDQPQIGSMNPVIRTETFFIKRHIELGNVGSPLVSLKPSTIGTLIGIRELRH